MVAELAYEVRIDVVIVPASNFSVLCIFFVGYLQLLSSDKPHIMQLMQRLGNISVLLFFFRSPQINKWFLKREGDRVTLLFLKKIDRIFKNKFLQQPKLNPFT